MAHPPPPWHLFGELIIVPALVRPRALGGVLLANYTSGTLVYRELIVFSHATRRGMVVSHIYVDDEQSLSGGHHIWGLPKELAEFEYTPTRFTARQNGATLLEASIRRRPGKLPLLIPAPIVSRAGRDAGLRPHQGRARAGHARRPAGQPVRRARPQRHPPRARG